MSLIRQGEIFLAFQALKKLADECQISIIGFFDKDGCMTISDMIKERILNQFCIEKLGKMNDECALPTEIHRRMLGRPMGEIFIQILAECYGKEMSEAESLQITEDLNDYIRPDYLSAPLFYGVREFYGLMRNICTEMYVLTGMEIDMAQGGLAHHGLDSLFDAILGAPKTKEQNIDNVLARYSGKKVIIISAGNAMSECRATMRYPDIAFFLALLLDGSKNPFPEGMKVYNEYGIELLTDIVSQTCNKMLEIL